MPRSGKKSKKGRMPDRMAKVWNIVASAEDNDEGASRPQRPPGLRGREIGVYYRNIQRNKKRRDYSINFRMPESVLDRLRVLLRKIAETEDGKLVKEGFEKKYSGSAIFKYTLADRIAEFIQPTPVNLPEFISLKKNTESTDFTYPEATVQRVTPSDKEPIETASRISGNDQATTSTAPDSIIIKQEPDWYNDASETIWPYPTHDIKSFESQSDLPYEEKSEIKRDNSNAYEIKKEYNIKPDSVIKKEYVNTEPNSLKKEISSSNNQGNSSTMPDFISIKREMSPSGEFNENDQLLSLRPREIAYKYGYKDIITGTFEEKLDECLAKGTLSKRVLIDMDSLNEAYYCEFEELTQSALYKEMLSFREQLPAYKKSEELLEAINNNQVIVISGETGCGKSTQVPQIILDNAILLKNGANTKIAVTQPRRIAASSLAQRVAQERGEHMGVSVGYAVRLEKIDPRPECSITFCTTGVLLSELEVNQGLTQWSHIILDEVHEKDANIDLTMCMLRQIIKKRKDLKVILMSATLDSDSISDYFDGCVNLHIEGLAYPVKDIYMEDILDMTGYIIMDRSGETIKRKIQRMEMETDIKYKAEIGPWIESKRHELKRSVIQSLVDSRIEMLDLQLLLTLLIHICKGEPGAILVFLPGIREISALIKDMNDSGLFPKSRYEIHPLHSKLASIEQHRIFVKPEPGIRKIIVATNIAETSITIDDIVYVVDSAKIKIKGLDVQENLSTLRVEWVSKTNLHQRRGRAGRCQPGICYHLVTSFRAERLPERMLPELQRSDLLEPVLTIKKLRLGKAAVALTMVPDQPAQSTIEWAVKHLTQCGALNEDESLTPLGWHMARVPSHPAAGKLLILSSLFGCLDRAATVAAVWGFKDPFLLAIGKEREADEAKRSFSLGEPSDHVAISEALIQWERAGANRRSFAYRNFLSNSTLELLVDMKEQFADTLKQMGFLPSGNIKSDWENRNCNNISLFKALVAASLYPNIATVRWTGGRKFNSIQRVSASLPDRRAALHPSSVMSSPPNQRMVSPLCHTPGANWLAYWQKQKSMRDLFLLEVSLVYTLPLLFFGEFNINNVEELSDDCNISVSSYKVCCHKQTACLLLELRTLLDHVLANKVNIHSDHAVRHSPFEEAVLNAVIEIITAEDEQTEYMSDNDSECDNDRRRRY